MQETWVIFIFLIFLVYKRNNFASVIVSIECVFGIKLIRLCEIAVKLITALRVFFYCCIWACLNSQISKEPISLEIEIRLLEIRVQYASCRTATDLSTAHKNISRRDFWDYFIKCIWIIVCVQLSLTDGAVRNYNAFFFVQIFMVMYLKKSKTAEKN